MSICIHPNPSHNLLSTGPLQWPTYWSIHISFSPHYHSTGSSQNEFLQRKLDYVILFLKVFSVFPYLGGSMEKFLHTVSWTWRVWLILFSLFPLSTTAFSLFFRCTGTCYPLCLECSSNPPPPSFLKMSLIWYYVPFLPQGCHSP